MVTTMYVVARGGDRFEIRESTRTSRGPRSRTLATFRELTPTVLAQVRERAQGTIDGEELRGAARRAGAAVGAPAVDAAAAELYRQLANGARLRPALARLLGAELPSCTAAPTAAERAAGAWLAATSDERGRALHDLLALTDRLPATRRETALRFPRLDTAR